MKLALLVLVLNAAGAKKPARLEVELAPPERAREVVKVLALDRNVPQKMTGKTVDIRQVAGERAAGRPGRWVVEGLAPGSYDLYVETKKGKFEGYALRPEEDSDRKVTAKDRGKIAEIFKGIKTFEEHKRILDLGGNGRQAVALVELLRTGKTSYAKKLPGAVIWRVEYWQFNKLYGVWRKGDYQVLRRFITTKDEFAKWDWNFVPELGGIDLKPGETRKLKWTVPAKFDPAKGRSTHKPAPKTAPAKKSKEKKPAAETLGKEPTETRTDLAAAMKRALAEVNELKGGVVPFGVDPVRGVREPAAEAPAVEIAPVRREDGR